MTKLGRRQNGNMVRTFSILAFAISFLCTRISPCLGRDCHTSFRRAWRDLTCQEQDDFLTAIVRVKDSGAYDEFIDVHLAVAQFTHGPAEFLPWHRWFIWNFEKLLQETMGRCIYIPYWDWERDAEWEAESDVMHPATFGSWGATSGAGCAMNGITNYHPPFQQSPGVNNGPRGCVTRNFLEGWSFTGEAQILAMIANYNQFADTTGAGLFNDQSNPTEVGTTNSFRMEFENGPHMLVHGIIAGHMGSNWSPSDPLFYLHHANIDRIWTMWQDYWDHDTCSTDEYMAPWHYDSEWGLNRRLPFLAAERLSSWDFRMPYTDSDPAYPTVRDVMNNDGPVMSVRYQNSYLNSLMPDYEPNPRLFQAATDTVPIKCNRDAWEWSRKRRNLEQEQKQKQNQEDLDHATPFKDLYITNISTPQMVFPESRRSSLRGDGAQDIENNIEHYFRRSGDRMKSSIAGNSAGVRPTSADVVELTNDVCGLPPVFTLQEDRDEWDRFCRELPASTTIAERLALLAESDCKRRGDPRSDAPEIKERVSFKAFDAPSSTYECFSRPESPPAK
mmetsp:Transcript_25494/g.59729  ORF Transcript_25494/g.59729 Transcript_25494/m.59729 type:complete len:559 (-) Transcript_25494:133-1809(-)